MAKVQFLLQGSSETENHRIIVEELRKVENLKGILISSAFLRSEGVASIGKILTEHKNIVKIYIGCRNGVTSFQGIKELVNIGIKPYLVDTGSMNFIFHSKTYLAYNDNMAISIVGSANLTLGGLVKNIEASTIAVLDLVSNNDDKEYIHSILNSFQNLETNHPENVVQLHSIKDVDDYFKEGKLIDELITKPRVVTKNTKEENEKKITPVMKTKMERIPRKSSGKDKTHVKVDDDAFTVTVSTTQLFRNGWTKMWESKELKERDLNIPKGINTHLTGSMTLKKGLYEEIDQRIYFRDKVFSKLVWVNKPNKGKLEYTEVDCFIIIEGINYGKYTLELKHDPRTDTASYLQNNAMTHLMWKDAKQFIANDKLLGKKMSLYDLNNSRNEFAIDISDFEDYDLNL